MKMAFCCYVVALLQVRMAADNTAVVWRVKWAGGSVTEHELRVELQEPELLVRPCFKAVPFTDMTLLPIPSCVSNSAFSRF